MRNLRRLEFEIRLLEKRFGHRNVSYPRDGSWVKISGYRLPQNKRKYNLRLVTVLIVIPADYDDASISAIYVDKDLRVKKGLGFQRLPHTHSGKYDGHGYNWLCFESPDEFVGLLDFVNTLTLYFTDPFRYQRL